MTDIQPPWGPRVPPDHDNFGDVIKDLASGAGSGMDSALESILGGWGSAAQTANEKGEDFVSGAGGVLSILGGVGSAAQTANEKVGGFVSGVKDSVIEAFHKDSLIDSAIKSVMESPLSYAPGGVGKGSSTTASNPTSPSSGGDVSALESFLGGGLADTQASMTTPLTPPTAEAPAMNEWDSSNLDFEQEALQKRLNMALETQLSEANQLFDLSMERHMDNPAIQVEVTKARQRAISMISDNHKHSLGLVGSEFAGLRTRAEAEFQETQLNRRRYDLEDEKLGIENQILKQQASQLLDPQGTEINTQPDMYRSILDKFIEVSGNTEDPAVRAVQQGINLLLDEYALGLASGDAELLGSWQSPYAPVDIQSLLAELDSEDRAPIESLLNEIYRGVVNDYRQAATS